MRIPCTRPFLPSCVSSCRDKRRLVTIPAEPLLLREAGAAARANRRFSLEAPGCGRDEETSVTMDSAYSSPASLLSPRSLDLFRTPHLTPFFPFSVWNCKPVVCFLLQGRVTPKEIGHHTIQTVPRLGNFHN